MKNYNRIFNEKQSQKDSKDQTEISENSIKAESVQKGHKKQQTVTPIEQSPTKAIVANCAQLYVRKKPDKQSAVLCVLNAGTTVVVEDQDDIWAHIYTSAGVDGYVMKDYIKEV